MDKEGTLSEALFFNTIDIFSSLWIHIERYANLKIHEPGFLYLTQEKKVALKENIFANDNKLEPCNASM